MKAKNGARATLELRPGAHPDDHPDPELRGKPIARSVTGVIRSFEQDGETRWEISTDDPQHPAVGFDPETAVLTKPS
jgi:hypothetical protein